MAAPTPAPDPAAVAALPAIALALRLGDASACEAAAVQLRDIVTKAPADAQAAVCVAVARNSEVVDAAFVQALGRPGMSDAAQHALVNVILTMFFHDDAKEASTVMMQACPVYLPILLRIIAQEQPVSACRFEAIRSVLRLIFGKHGKANVAKLPIGLLPALVRVVDSDTDTDNINCAMNCFNTIACSAPAYLLADSEAVACALRVVRQQGTDMTAWAFSAKFGCTLTTKAVGFLTNVSGAAVGAHMLRLMDAQSTLLPISFLPDDEQHTANLALMCLINIMGNQEGAKGEDSPIMVMRPDVVSLVLTDFDNMLDSARRHLSCNRVSSVVRACLVLSESDSNKPHLRSSNLLHLTAETLKLYASNAPSLTRVLSNGLLGHFGGGGNDPECAQLCMELLLQLSFCYPSEGEWRSAAAQQCPDLHAVLLAVRDLPPDRSLEVHSMLTLKHLLATLHSVAPPLAVSKPAVAATCQQHVMLSYCWGAKKELVVQLAAGLRAKSMDVWRDEEGSQCVPAMSGSTDDCMADAIERSHTIIICVSPAYKASANCRMEAKYANDMHKRGKVKLVFVMMEQAYTTRSSPEYVDGWLGLMIGDHLWHAMWAHDQVAAVAAAIHVAIGPASAAAAAAPVAAVVAAPAAAHALLHPTSPAAASALAQPSAAPPVTLSPTQPSQPHVLSSPSTPSLKRAADPTALPQASSAKTVRMPPPTSPAAAADVPVSPLSQPSSPSAVQLQQPLLLIDDDKDATVALSSAFECLRDADKARNSAVLADLLHSLGVKCAADLAHVDDAAASRIKELLKPAAAHSFATSWVCARALHSMRADATHASITSGHTDQCFAYLQDATKHVDPGAMAALLQQLGVSLPHELQYLDDAQLGSVVALLKPVAAKVFASMMLYVRRGF